MVKQRTWRGHSLRYGRFSEKNQVYLITTVTTQRTPLFDDFYAGRIVVNALKKQNEYVNTWAFVIMPDHLHWLVQLKKGTISDAVGKVKGGSGFHLNRYLNRAGPVWQSGFYDTTIRTDDHARCAARYIIANPVRAGLVASVRQYPLWDAIWL